MNTLRKIFFNKASYLILFLFLLLCIWSLALWLSGNRATIWNYVFNIFLGFVPLTGGVIAMYRCKQWGGLSSSLGKILFFIGLGLFSWAPGTGIWICYNFFFDVVIPYPSLADLGYMLVYPLWGTGIILFGYVTALRDDSNIKERIYFLCIPVLMAIVTYYFIFVDLYGNTVLYEGNLLKFLVDMGYPMGEIVIITLLVIISGSSFNYLGKRLKLPFSIMVIGLIANYVADFYFSYSTTVEIYYNGAFSDLLFVTSLSIFSLGVNCLRPSLLED